MHRQLNWPAIVRQFVHHEISPVRSRLLVMALTSRSVSISGSGLIEGEAELTGTVVKLSFSEQLDPNPKKAHVQLQSSVDNQKIQIYDL